MLRGFSLAGDVAMSQHTYSDLLLDLVDFSAPWRVWDSDSKLYTSQSWLSLSRSGLFCGRRRLRWGPRKKNHETICWKACGWYTRFSNSLVPVFLSCLFFINATWMLFTMWLVLYNYLRDIVNNFIYHRICFTNLFSIEVEVSIIFSNWSPRVFIFEQEIITA